MPGSDEDTFGGKVASNAALMSSCARCSIAGLFVSLLTDISTMIRLLNIGVTLPLSMLTGRISLKPIGQVLIYITQFVT